MLLKKTLIFATFAIASFFLDAQKANATLDLEVPLEMVDLGLNSQTSTTTFARTAMNMNASDYADNTANCQNPNWDHATFYFEIVGEFLATYSTITLRDVTNNIDKISIDTSGWPQQFPRRWRSLSFTPACGNIEYRIKVSGTDSAADYRVHSARIIVVQTNATKTRIQIPLVQRYYTASLGTAGNVDVSPYIGYNQPNPERYSLWKKNTSDYANLAASNPWTLEAVLDINVGNLGCASLFNATTGQQVSSSEICTSNTSATLRDVNFSNSVANFSEGDNFEVKIFADDQTGQIELRSAARLYVRLENLRKAEVYYRVGRQRSGTAAVEMAEQRALIDKTKFSNPAIFFESSGYCADTSAHLFLADDGTNDYGTGGSNIAQSGINFSSGTKAIKRSGDITANITSGNRFYAQSADSTSNLEISHAWLVVQATEQQLFHRWDGTLKFFGTLKFL